MAARFCPFCGSPVVAGGTFCPSCGASLSGNPAAGGSPGAPPSFAPLGATPGLVGASPSILSVTRAADVRATDLEALSSVTIAAVLGLIGQLVGLVALFVTPTAGLLMVTTTSSGTTFAANPSGLIDFGILVSVGTVLTILELIYYRDAFHTLSPHDDRFSTPSTLVTILLVALPIVLLSAIALLDLLYESIACAGIGNPIPANCINGGSVLAAVAVLGIAAVLALIGYVGLLVGIWRLGTRYDSSAFKVGAVLLLIPLLNVVAAILIIVSARSCRERVAAEGSSMTFG
ncbi:MAG: DUF973 family protein [Thermoplasmata archaeon]|nr:DUF973 family protein [Thermoplasmata archaeon]